MSETFPTSATDPTTARRTTGDEDAEARANRWRPADSGDVVHEAYSFACLRCAHAWEQDYEIRHHTDVVGHVTAVYLADGRPVPSPLTKPTCAHCGGHLVRIMQAGTVAAHREPRPGDAPDTPADGAGPRHHWHLPALLRSLTHHRGPSPSS